MANWCSNRLLVTGPAGSVRTFRDRAATVADGMPTELSFGAFVPGPDDEEGRIDAWGCRFEAEDAKVSDHSDEAVEWRFLTPASPPIEWLEKVGPDHPELSFDLVFAEPMAGFAGRLFIERGGTVVAAEWTGKRARRELEAVGADELWLAS
ncbi:MAG: hypothetical protein EPN50_10675 [Chloroflexota bacterium]|nr:MAG: hypothetical protein EPN50_10675 [Chloroflexota bacterium]